MGSDLFSGKKVLIIGLGRFGGGLDSAKFAAGSGAEVIVTDIAGANELSESIGQLSDYKNIEYHLAGHVEQDFIDAEVVIVNPAVCNDNKFLGLARSNGATVTSQVCLFFDSCPATIVGITGSNGKSTTAALTAHLLSNAGWADNRKVWLSGNIGNEPLLMLLDEIGKNDIVVLELSSFQIEQLALENKAPQTALITNLLPNHLDRYGTFENYCAAKENIFINQKLNEDNPAVSIFNSEDKLTAQWLGRYSNDKGRRCLSYSVEDIPQEIESKFGLVGRCNLSNLAGAAAVAGLFGVENKDIERCVCDFASLPHRLELIAEHKGIKWYNDSKATTPESTIAALQGFDKSIVLIAGGYDKKLSFDELASVIAEKVKAVFLIGQTADKIKSSIKSESTNSPEIEICGSLEEAVNKAGSIAGRGDVVLFSPACASYDMFDNYRQRGESFIKLVNPYQY